MSEVTQNLPQDAVFQKILENRHRRGKVWRNFFFLSNIVALLALIVLLVHVINGSAGYVIIRNRVEPATLSERPLTELSEPELVNVLVENASNSLRVIIRDTLSAVPNAEFTTAPIGRVLAGRQYPSEWDDRLINELSTEEQAQLLSDNLSQGDIYDLITRYIVEPIVVRSWRVIPSIFERSEIEAIAAEEFPNDTLEFRSWLNFDFISSPVSSSPTTAGLRTALLGSAWIILITVVTAFPIGIGAAIYLEEYARKNWFNRLIEINIRNLAAVPSIIYGLLGLAVFVRAVGNVTSGAVFGITDTNGRTVLSAGLTLALVILPIIIINAREAIRAVPSSIRDASYGLGANKWQTVRQQVLPVALPGILTGIILSMSRAVGETAPLIVVGASTFIGIDPNGPFSKFTVVPIQIYEWTRTPDQEFRNTAAAAIIMLLIVMISINGTAIILRNRFSRRVR